MSDITAPSQPWYRSLSRSQWNTLIAANLGWLFDGYETYALVIAVGVALRQLLDPSQYSQIPVYAGTVIALTLLGWGIGRLIGGVIVAISNCPILFNACNNLRLKPLTLEILK